MKRIIPLALPLWFISACGPSTREANLPPQSTKVPQLASLVPSAAPATSKPTSQGPRPLKLVLFPYIPDAAGDKFQSLMRELKNGFEQAHPQINLQIVIDGDMDLYDLTPGNTLNRLLGSGAEAAQVVEIDTILLGDLVANKWVQPTGMKPSEAFQAAQQAASINGEPYAVPTYLCSNVIYARSNTIQKATNGLELVAALTKIDPKAVPIAGNFLGSWTLPSTYVDAWADTKGTTNLRAAYHPTLDPRTMTDLRAVIHSCKVSGKNPCMDKTYKDNTEAEKAYALGKANGFFGYTERLYYIRAAKPDSRLPAIISAPVGDGTRPVMFVDALVFNPGCTGQCLADAQDVATYMASVPVRTLIAFSQDAPQGAIPRYLLQASQGFYLAPPASADPMYQAYLPIVSRAQPYPNQDFPEARQDLNKALLAALTAPPDKSVAPPKATSR
jgi:thiamine pyridinylase